MTPGTRPAGTTPAGVEGEEQIARHVRRMFDGAAPRYDLLNRIISLNLDVYWRWRTVRMLQPILDRPDARAVDLCCGSGDLLIALRRKAQAKVWGTDFSHGMLQAAQRKGLGAAVFEGDALKLPFRDGTLDLLTVAFGFRNFANYRKGLEEMLRVLKPGGTAAILEMSTPPNVLFRAFYNLYFRHILPLIGAALSGEPEAYSYLPESVRKFPGAEGLADAMREAGFPEVRFVRFTFGIVAVHIGIKGSTA